MNPTINQSDLLPGSPGLFCQAVPELIVAADDQDWAGTAPERRAEVWITQYAEGGSNGEVERRPTKHEGKNQRRAEELT